MNDISHELA
jgi:hypothetical protein